MHSLVCFEMNAFCVVFICYFLPVYPLFKSMNELTNSSWSWRGLTNEDAEGRASAIYNGAVSSLETETEGEQLTSGGYAVYETDASFIVCVCSVGVDWCTELSTNKRQQSKYDSQGLSDGGQGSTERSGSNDKPSTGRR